MSTPFAPASLLQLMCFVRVVEAGSFAEAGRRLGMTTSGVSKAISRFETEHGVRLLHRSTHALSLTDEGEQVLDDARDVLRGCERLGLALSQATDGGRAGRVRINAPPGFTRACLLPVLPRLLDAHPEIHVEIHTGYNLVDLADEGIDLALRTGQLVGLPGHVSQALFSSPAGKESISWLPSTYAKNGMVFEARFATRDCFPCPLRPRCTRAKREPRIIGLQAREHFETLQGARKQQKTAAFRANYAARAGIECTHAQAISRCGLRQCRYIGLAKTRLQHVLTAAAINLVRVAEWYAGTPVAKTRCSRFATLQAAA